MCKRVASLKSGKAKSRHYPAVGRKVSSLLGHPSLPPRVTRNIGRPRGQSSDTTRERILDAAEQLFAANGYDGTSIRAVAAASNCQIQAVSYHFGQKDQLFDTVVRRRAAVMTDLRIRALASLRSEAKDAPIEVSRLIRAYVEPFIASANDGNEGWRNFAALMGRLANSRLGTEVIGRHYDSTARDYIEELARSLPHATERAVIESFMFMVASMLFICADTGRVERLSKTRTAEQSTHAVLERLVNFLVAGFKALADSDYKTRRGSTEERGKQAATRRDRTL